MTNAPAIDPAVEREIQYALDRAQAEHAATILHAAESGSRAWGFASPDSDYDVRFIYAHEREAYLSVYPGRDVIEYPITGIFDVGGWDLKKALHLALKSNAVVMEWLSSPILYRGNPQFAAAMRDFCARAADRKALLHHYLNLGKRQVDQNWRTAETVNVKKYLYVLRPALAIRWLRVQGGPLQSLPMNVRELMAASGITADVQSAIDDIIARKAGLTEGQETGRIRVLDEFAQSEFTAAETLIAALPARTEDLRPEADALFRAWLK